MMSSKTAQIIKYCGIFFILLIFLSFDLALSITISLYLALSSGDYIKLLIVSLILFALDFLLKYFDLSIRYISDMSLDSYVFLLASVFIYLKSQQKIVDYFQELARNSRKVISTNTLMIIGISSVFSLLLAPVLGIPFAVISGYISFSYLTKHFEGKYAYIAGLFFLALSPLFIIAGKDNISENLAIISFFFLIIGTIQEGVKIVMGERSKVGFTKIKVGNAFKPEKKSS